MLNVRLDLLFSGRIKILRICIIYILEFNQRRVNVLNSNIRFDSLSRRYLTRLTTCSTTYHQAYTTWEAGARPPTHIVGPAAAYHGPRRWHDTSQGSSRLITSFKVPARWWHFSREGNFHGNFSEWLMSRLACAGRHLHLRTWD